MAFHECRGGPAAALPWVIKRALRWHLQHSEGLADGLVRPPDAGDAEPRLAPFREHHAANPRQGLHGNGPAEGFFIFSCSVVGIDVTPRG